MRHVSFSGHLVSFDFFRPFGIIRTEVRWCALNIKYNYILSVKIRKTLIMKKKNYLKWNSRRIIIYFFFHSREPVHCKISIFRKYSGRKYLTLTFGLGEISVIFDQDSLKTLAKHTNWQRKQFFWKITHRLMVQSAMNFQWLVILLVPEFPNTVEHVDILSIHCH